LERGDAHSGQSRTEASVEVIVARISAAEFVGCRRFLDSSEASVVAVSLERALDRQMLQARHTMIRCGTSVWAATGQWMDIGYSAVAAAEWRRRELARPDKGGHSAEGQFDDELSVIARLQALLDSGGPDIVFQPICSAHDLSIVGYEALSRFPVTGGSTDAWFADAARTGYGPALDRAAVEAAARIPAGAFLSMNTSASTRC